MTDKLKYKLASRLYGYSSIKAVLARCRYQPWRYLLLPMSLITAFFKRMNERRKGEGVIDYSRKGAIRPVAFYLPQYHRIPENDKWWGEGFVEWTNVRKAKPLFEGHYQPHVPHPDLGYYDLSDVAVMKKQAEIAKKYGVYGFCFYYYHFKDGKRLLEKPIDNWLAHTEIDFPFCFCWANENWTRAWDGGDKEILMPQDYEFENMQRMMREMVRAFKDKRYIKIDGKPMLLVYRPEIVANVKSVVESWRQIVRDNGFEDVYVVMVQNFSSNSPLEFGMDAATEFACTKAEVVEAVDSNDINVESMKVSDIAVRYCAVRKHHRSTSRPDGYLRYKCVCPGWDNTARKGSRGHFIVDASPAGFGRFCDEAFSATLADGRNRSGLVFVNAWNEWGEGAHLEPDEKSGYANLEQLASSIARFAPMEPINSAP